MDYERSRNSLLQESINHYRSTSDLIPKCRSEALKEKRASIRSKINHLAKQIYDLKYDQEWQSHKLSQLVKKGEYIFQEAQEKLKEVKDQSRLLVAIQCESSNLLSLQLTSMQLKGSAFTISERSTQSQVNASQLAEKKEVFEEKKQEQKLNDIISSNLQQKKTSVNKTIFANNQMTRSLKTAQEKCILQPSKNNQNKMRVNEETFLNISIFIALIIIVLLLL